MANRHFAKLADVWKHLPLAEMLAIEQPTAYWESHAGNATYEMVDDPERQYGVSHFVVAARASRVLVSSRYVHHLAAVNDGGALTVYPGSPLLAMRERGSACSYVFCDLDGGSGRDLQRAGDELGVDARVVVGDGMQVLHDTLTATRDRSTVFAHVDPYDPFTATVSGRSPLDLAGELIGAGVATMYWYGYDRPHRRRWAVAELARRAPVVELWCGDVRIEAEAEPHVFEDGDLGEATTAGTGFGIVVANVSAASLASCEVLGSALRDAYQDVPLPDGTRGRLAFTTS